MSSIYLSDQLKAKLVRAARRRGYLVERGRQSQLAEYLAYLIHLDEQTGRSERPRRTLDQALGLLSVAGGSAPSDEAIRDILAERRMRK
ncbi:MAG TPA: hypothetical protein PK954_24495 [Anaerolineales bacterium]|nr:hypothetical protein [Anaerolineales bacterium]HRF50783.1 hypothetical protein [Anaerolineales bacterium]